MVPENSCGVIWRVPSGDSLLKNWSCCPRSLDLVAPVFAGMPPDAARASTALQFELARNQGFRIEA